MNDGRHSALSEHWIAPLHGVTRLFPDVGL